MKSSSPRRKARRLWNGPTDISSGPNTIQLIKFGSSRGDFASDNIIINGLPESTTPKIKKESDGIYLQITEGPTGPTGVPTSVPTKGPTKSPTNSPTSTPGNPTNAPTNPPTTVSGPTTTIVLSSSGFDDGPLTSTGTCPAPETTQLIVDGSAYTAGEGTITLYQCSNINSNFEPIRIKLIGFPPGLWFEMVYTTSQINLKIKSLINYKEYWSRVRNTYKGEYGFQTNTDHFPEFSWNTVPRWISFRKNPNKGPFTDEDINSIATNNYMSWFGLGTPASVIDMCTRIKTVNSKYKMLLYWNAESYWGSDIDSFDEKWLRDETGTGGRALYNHAIPAMRNWWVNHALLMDSDDSIDGAFADNTRLPAGKTTDKSLMIKRLADSLPANSLKMGNFLRQRDDDGNRWRMEYEDGSYFENHHSGPINQPKPEPAIVSMQMAREASWKRKLVMWNGSRRNCGCASLPPSDVPPLCKGYMNVDEEPVEKIEEDLNISLAEYLMIAEEFSYFSYSISPDASCEKWRWDSSYKTQFQRPLGEPLGPPIRVANTFSRHFQHVSAMINLDTEEYTINWL